MSGLLTHSPADVVRRLIIDLSLGTFPTSPLGAWPVYTDGTPELPDGLIVVYDTIPKYQGRNHHTGYVYEHHGISIKIRSGIEPEAAQKANQIAQALDTVKRQTVTVPALTISGFSLPQTEYLVHSMNRAYQLRGSASYLYLGKERTQTNVNDIVLTSQRPLFGLNFSVSLTQV